MALKDHVIDSKKASEEEIEAIIHGRAKYDPQTKTIVLVRQNLTSRAKILLYLVALKGWPFILEASELPADDASPKELSEAIRVPGNTIRPILGDLVSAGLILGREGRYKVATSAMPAIRATIVDQQVESSDGKDMSDHSGASSVEALVAHKKSRNSRPVTSSRSKPTLAKTFKKLLADGFFRDGRTIGELKKELDRLTLFPQITDLSGYLLAAYRRQELDRVQEKRGNRLVFVYRQT